MFTREVLWVVWSREKDSETLGTSRDNIFSQRFKLEDRSSPKQAHSTMEVFIRAHIFKSGTKTDKQSLQADRKNASCPCLSKCTNTHYGWEVLSHRYPIVSLSRIHALKGMNKFFSRLLIACLPFTIATIISRWGQSIRNSAARLRRYPL